MSATDTHALGVSADIANRGAPTDATASSAVIMNSWVVMDGDQEEFVEAIVRLLDRLRTLDGFIEGELLQGVNPTRFVSYVLMRSARARQYALDSSEVRTLTRAAAAFGRPDLHSYDVVRVFRPPAT
jgi:heme-degrading monooxygenase HmoA